MFNRKQPKFRSFQASSFNHDKFQSDFAKAEKRFNLMWKLVLGFIFLVTCAIVAVWGLIGYGVVKYGPKAVQTGEHVLERLDREATSDQN